MARVFISYARTDSRFAIDFRTWLKAAGHEVFLDQDVDDGIRAGTDWQERLHERLRWADAVVCVVSAASVASTWCVFEVSTAMSLGTRILPVVLESGVRHPLLTRLQHVAFDHDMEQSRAQLAADLRVIDAGGGGGWPDDRSPFPGLRPFDVDQHRVFFGRGPEIRRLVTVLRSPAERADPGVVLVEGPSGCGKSSLVRAGLVPAMTAEPGWWVLAPMKPGADPVAALVRELAGGLQAVGRDIAPAEVRDQVRRDGLVAVVDELLSSAPGARRTRLLVVVDQLEEILTQTPAEERARFARLLAPALSGGVQVVATLRTEFQDPIRSSPELAELPLCARPFAVRPMTREALPAVITEPARRAGITVDDGLAARLVADTAGGEALPLLAYTLEQLADGVERGGRLLMSRYEQLGGVQGTLSRQADAALAEAVAAGARDRDAVLRGVLQLVTVDDEGHPARRRLPRSELPDELWAEWTPFATRRLLTTGADGGVDVVEVAHEAFLSAWPPLAGLISDNATALRARSRVEQAAAEWVAQLRPRRRLWTGDQLAAARSDTGARLVAPAAGGRPAGAGSRWARRRRMVTDKVPTSASAREFLHAGVRRDRFLRGRVTTGLAALSVLAVAAAVVAGVQLDVATSRQRQVTAQSLLSQARSAVSTDPRAALRLAAAAHRLDPAPPTDDALSQLLTATPYLATLTSGSAVKAVAFAPEGDTVATGGTDNAVTFWDVRDTTRPGRRTTTATAHGGALRSMAFSPDGHTVDVCTDDGTVVHVSAQEPSGPSPAGRPPLDRWSRKVVSPDGLLMAATGPDDSVTVFDVRDPLRPRQLGTVPIGGPSSGYALAFSHDDRTVAVGDGAGSVIVFDVGDPARPRRLAPLPGGLGGSVQTLAFSPDGRILGAGGFDDTVALWDVHDASRLQLAGPAPTSSAGWVTAMAFSPDGQTLATGSSDKTAVLWDLRDPGRYRLRGPTLTGHADEVTSMAFSPDGQTLATGSDDKTVILWDVRDPRRYQVRGSALTGRTVGVAAAAFAHDGRTLATVGGGGTFLWDVRNPDRPQRLGSLSDAAGSARSVAFFPDGRTLVTSNAADDYHPQQGFVWDTADLRWPRRLDSSSPAGIDDVGPANLSPDGRLMATGSTVTPLVLWDVRDRTRPRPLELPANDHVASPGLAFSPDARILVAGTSGDSVTVWDTGDPDGVRLLTSPQTGPLASAAFSPDGHYLATAGGDNSALLWDMRDPARPRILGSPLAGHTGTVNAVAFSPDGRTLATVSDDQTVLLWDVRDPSRPQHLGSPLTGHAGRVRTAAFSPDGQTLATGGADDTVILWDVAGLVDTRDHAAEIVCARSGGGLAEPDWTRTVDLPYEPSCP